MSNLQGTHVVASMVVFEQGLARKSEYRRFSIRGLDGTDDVAAIHEVILRRFRRYLDKREATGELDVLGDPEVSAEAKRGSASSPTRPPGRDRRWPGPGRRRGPGARTSSASTTSRPAAWPSGWRRSGCPARTRPVILPRTSEGLYLLQRVRDEAHRFAITYHRAKRSKALAVSELDSVPGLGPARRATLLRHFGSVRRLASATEPEIAGLPGIGPRVASAVLAALRPAEPAGEQPAERRRGRQQSTRGTARRMAVTSGSGTAMPVRQARTS